MVAPNAMKRCVVMVLALSFFASSFLHAAADCRSFLQTSERITHELREAFQKGRETRPLLVQILVDARFGGENKAFQRALTSSGLRVLSSATLKHGLARVEVVGAPSQLQAALLENQEVRSKYLWAGFDNVEAAEDVAFEELYKELVAEFGIGKPNVNATIERSTNPADTVGLKISVREDYPLSQALAHRTANMPVQILLSDVGFVLGDHLRTVSSRKLQDILETPSSPFVGARIVLRGKEQVDVTGFEKLAKSSGATLKALSMLAHYTDHGYWQQEHEIHGSPSLMAILLENPTVIRATSILEAHLGESVLAAIKNEPADKKVQITLALTEAGRKTAKDFLASKANEVTLVDNGTWYQGSDWVEHFPNVTKMNVCLELSVGNLKILLQSLDAGSHAMSVMEPGSFNKYRYDLHADYPDNTGRI